MNPHSEEFLSDEVQRSQARAQVLQFERPQSELQKAVQQRAQETIDRARDRAAAQRPSAMRRALVLVLAAIPVVITFGAAIGFVGALRQFNAAVFESTASEEPSPAPQTAPAATQNPDVVMLQPYAVPPAPAEREDGTSTESPSR